MQESLALADEDWGVSVMAFCPAATATQTFLHGEPSLPPSVPGAPWRRFYSKMLEHIDVARYIQ